MAGRTCYPCKQWIEDGVDHDCWTTTEGALLRDLPEDLTEAYERLRETAVTFGEQRDLRFPQVDHVLASILLFLCASEEELS